MNTTPPVALAGRTVVDGRAFVDRAFVDRAFVDRAFVDRAFVGRVLVGSAFAGLVLGATAGCSSSAAPPQSAVQPQHAMQPYAAQNRPVAEVTGFRSGSIFGFPGPVTIRITGQPATRLAELVSQLPAASPPDCHEGPGLIYRIAFSAGSVAHSTAVVDGYRCGAEVALRSAGQVTSWRHDPTCELYRAVRQVLPDRAKATHDFGVGCNGPPSPPGP
jgi:hypothetical protein